MGMIALIPSDADLARIALDGGEPIESLHLTLFILDEMDQEEIQSRMGIVAAAVSQIDGTAFGAAIWNPDGVKPCTVLNVNGDELEPIHDLTEDALFGLDIPAQYEPWSPHICLAYDPMRIDDALNVVGPITFDKIRVAFDSGTIDIPLAARDTVVAQEAKIMPWHKVNGHSGCPSSKPWAVIKDSDGSVAGCHPTEDAANAQLAALYGSEHTIESHDFATVDNTAWDGGAAMASCDAAACYRSICAGRRDGPPNERQSWALPHHKHQGGPPNAAGVRNALARLDQTQGLTNKAAARAHLERHMSQIQANTVDENAGGYGGDGGCPPGHHKMPNGDCMPDGSMSVTVKLPESAASSPEAAPAPADVPAATAEVDDGRWNGVLVVEDTPSGDGRRFASGALTWRDLPIPLYWQRMTADGHASSVIVGNIEEIWRDGANIMGRGRFNLNADPGTQNYRDAWDAYQLVRDGFMRGVSVTVDDVKNNDIDMVWPEPADGGDMGGLESLFMDPEEIIFNHARIMDGTLTGQPAYQQAFIQIGDVQAPQSLSAAAEPHDSGTLDDPWDITAVLSKIPARFEVTTARTMFAWVQGSGTVTKAHCRIPHHTLFGGPANIAACSAGIAMLNGARGGTDIPDADRTAVYAHLAQHILAAGLTPPPLVPSDAAKEQATLTAALHVPVTPPAAWFENPNFSEITPIQVGDDGWIRGHLAKWGACHTSFANTCVTPPHEDEFSYFTTGELVTRDGVRVPVGQLTMGTGHAPQHLEARPAAVHYDHTGFAVADVACGADQHGIWVAGALCPDVDELTVRRLRASALSGDWRRIQSRLRLVAALVVNVPGFPIPRTKSHVHDGVQSALVASGVVTNTERMPTPAPAMPAKVTRLVAQALRDEVMGPKIEEMRRTMKVGADGV